MHSNEVFLCRRDVVFQHVLSAVNLYASDLTSLTSSFPRPRQPQERNIPSNYPSTYCEDTVTVFKKILCTLCTHENL